MELSREEISAAKEVCRAVVEAERAERSPRVVLRVVRVVRRE